MAQYKQLQEEIVIENLSNSEKEKNCISIIIRNIKNDNTKITFDSNKLKLIKDLKSEVNIFSIRLSILLMWKKGKN